MCYLKLTNGRYLNKKTLHGDEDLGLELIRARGTFFLPGPSHRKDGVSFLSGS